MSDLPQRRSIRLQGYDYRRAGAYYVTICAFQRENLFGEIVDGMMRLNPSGEQVDAAWRWLGEHHAYIDLDSYVIMPNHLHGVLVLTEADPFIKSKSLGSLIGAFKTVSSKVINQARETPGAPVWQRDFYEHIVRNEPDLNRIRDYILHNPTRWSEDEENPFRRGGS